MTLKGFVGYLYKQMLSVGIEIEPYTSVQNCLKKNFGTTYLALGTAVVHTILYPQY